MYATAYGDAAVTKIHRPYQTILGLSRRLDVPIQSPDLLDVYTGPCRRTLRVRPSPKQLLDGDTDTVICSGNDRKVNSGASRCWCHRFGARII
jgi:hypothetical protein